MSERSCVICRKRDEKENLWRFVTRESISDKLVLELLFDPQQRFEGRGLYAHPECYEEKNLIYRAAKVFKGLSKNGPIKGVSKNKQ